MASPGWATTSVSSLPWGVTGLIVVPFGLVLWSDISGTGQELGFLFGLYVAAGAGLVAGAAAGAVAGSTRAAGASLAWGRRVLLGVAAVAFLYTAVVAL